jgi:hypothetical protein
LPLPPGQPCPALCPRYVSLLNIEHEWTDLADVLPDAKRRNHTIDRKLRRRYDTKSECLAPTHQALVRCNLHQKGVRRAKTFVPLSGTVELPAWFERNAQWDGVDAIDYHDGDPNLNEVPSASECFKVPQPLLVPRKSGT